MKNLIKAIAVVVVWAVAVILGLLPVIGGILLVGWIANFDMTTVCVVTAITDAVITTVKFVKSDIPKKVCRLVDTFWTN